MSRGRRITFLTCVLALGAGAVVFRLVGCTTGSLFDKPGPGVIAPTTATRTDPTQPVELLAGQWEGQWKSSSADRGGKLQAVITKRSDGDYDAKFRAQVLGPLKVDQEVTFKIGQRGRTWEFSGQKDLGALRGGVYTYVGTSDGSTFTCTYDSSFDKGRFELSRPGATTAPSTRPSWGECAPPDAKP